MANAGRKYDPSNIDLKIECIEPFCNDHHSGFVICWSSNIVFGKYTIYKDCGSGKWYASSGGMDSKEDKAFLMELFRLIADSVEEVF